VGVVFWCVGFCEGLGRRWGVFFGVLIGFCVGVWFVCFLGGFVWFGVGVWVVLWVVVCFWGRKGSILSGHCWKESVLGGFDDGRRGQGTLEKREKSPIVGIISKKRRVDVQEGAPKLP